jgi:hypothetical protein
MREHSPEEIRALAIDLELELGQMQRLEQDILVVQREIERDPDRANLFYEVQALACSDETPMDNEDQNLLPNVLISRIDSSDSLALSSIIRSSGRT